MKTIFKTYRFKLQPTQQQRILLEKHFGCTRFIYNHFLNERKQQYQQRQIVTAQGRDLGAQRLNQRQEEHRPRTDV